MGPLKTKYYSLQSPRDGTKNKFSQTMGCECHLDPCMVGANLLLAGQDIETMYPMTTNAVKTNNETIM